MIDRNTEAPMTQNPCYALFFLGIQNRVCVLIPKKRGKGYLKSPFGGHHANLQYRKFNQSNLEKVGDCVDIDGYLSVDIRANSWGKDYYDVVHSIMDELMDVFPQIKGYEEIDSPTFWSHVK